MNATTLRVEDIVEELRSTAQAARELTPTTAQVRILVNDIWNMVSLTETEARPEMGALTAENLIDIAGEFGKRRSQSLKSGLVGRRERVDSGATGFLFPPSEDEVRQVRELLEQGVRPYRRDGKKNTRSSAVPRGFPRELYQALEVAKNDWGLLPYGYDRDGDHGRDVHKSLAAVLAQPVADAEIIRFVSRTYTVPTMVLHPDHVRLFHWFVTHDLTPLLLQLVGKEVNDDGQVVAAAEPEVYAPLAKMLVAAYDLLEVARLDAMRAMARLVRGEVLAPGAVRDALVAARWLAPGPIGKLLQLTERVLGDPDNERLARMFPSAVDTFRHTVRTAPDAFVVRHVGQMNEAHVQQVLTLAGMNVDETEEKAVRAELRARLVDMGLLHDLEIDLPEALRAWHAGRLEEFFASRQARVDGDPDWADLYTRDDVEIVV